MTSLWGRWKQPRPASWHENQIRFWWPRRHRVPSARRYILANAELLRKARRQPVDSAALRVWVETCRDLGRGALRECQEQVGWVDIEEALDIFDRQIDNILGSLPSA